MTTTSSPDKDHASLPSPSDYENYFEYLADVREYKGLRMIDVINASAHPEFPAATAKKSTLSRMEAGEIKNPSFRQIIIYARAYGVKLEDLTIFFLKEYARAKK